MSNGETKRKGFHKNLYFWVLVAVVLGALFGLTFPAQAAGTQWVAELFINLVKMVIAPTIFCTIVVGIAGLGNLAKAGGLALRTIGYFTVMTMLALAIGLAVVNIIKPGADLHLKFDEKVAADTIKKAQGHNTVQDFVLGLVPKSFVSAFTDGQLIQVLVIAVLVAISLSMMGERGKPVIRALDTLGHVMFGIIKIIMYAAPVGAFAGMAYTVGKFGNQVLGQLLFFMGSFYLTCILFIVLVLGTVAAIAGFNIFKFIRLIKDELLIVLGTSSSESVLPRMLTKLESAGADKSVVGLTIPTGYSFNLDGTCIYLTMGALFIAQATGHDLPLGTQLGLLLFMLLSSKGAAGVTGAGLVTLAASLSAFNDLIPVVGVALIVGIDRFMSEARSLTNLVGNGVATMVIAKWQNSLDMDRFREVLNNPKLADPDDSPVASAEPAAVH
ncbi:C4-dicarboxylate transporter DctA [Pseudonocardiaceae bacterium YIM PH 21723]|nr:C4-dicarboxylate transporter DctA [Pseudonocardiaceae bacterium YIM PH 21723]